MSIIVTAIFGRVLFGIGLAIFTAALVLNQSIPRSLIGIGIMIVGSTFWPPPVHITHELADYLGIDDEDNRHDS